MSASFEIDHLFVMTTPGAAAADRLVEGGLTEGASRSHPGQGTTNRRFFFDNAMLEFLWVHDPAEAGSESVRPTCLLDRWRRRDDGGSPFGICFRPVAGAAAHPPFDAWKYEPPYLPPGREIYVADNAALGGKPFLFYLPWGRPPDDPPRHDAGLRTLTAVTVHAPGAKAPSDALRTVDRVIDLERAERHHLTLVFDDGARGATLDLRPVEPLTIRY
jgi:hypothetical protein